jgi:hypothetical protein
MSETLAAAPAPGVASFASFLAGLAAPETTGSDDWNVDDLAEDVATISYEQALRSLSSHPAGDGPALSTGVKSTKLPAEDAGVAAAAAKGRDWPASGPRTGAPADNRKSASITIRLSQAESAQLHERAAAAGMTISAYLRSCTFEMEAMRAQVKEALAQFNSATVAPVEATKAPEKPAVAFQTWRSRFFPRRPVQV